MIDNAILQTARWWVSAVTSICSRAARQTGNTTHLLAAARSIPHGVLVTPTWDMRSRLAESPGDPAVDSVARLVLALGKPISPIFDLAVIQQMAEAVAAGMRVYEDHIKSLEGALHYQLMRRPAGEHSDLTCVYYFDETPWAYETAPITLAVTNPGATPEPPPSPGEGDVWQEIIDTLPAGPLREACTARRQMGIDKYGTPLQRGNLRDARIDEGQELLDAAAYRALRSGPHSPMVVFYLESARDLLFPSRESQ